MLSLHYYNMLFNYFFTRAVCACMSILFVIYALLITIICRAATIGYFIYLDALLLFSKFTISIANKIALQPA